MGHVSGHVSVDCANRKRGLLQIMKQSFKAIAFFVIFTTGV